LTDSGFSRGKIFYAVLGNLWGHLNFGVPSTILSELSEDAESWEFGNSSLGRVYGLVVCGIMDRRSIHDIFLHLAMNDSLAKNFG